jgi:hypothetical protein
MLNSTVHQDASNSMLRVSPIPKRLIALQRTVDSAMASIMQELMPTWACVILYAATFLQYECLALPLFCVAQFPRPSLLSIPLCHSSSHWRMLALLPYL